MAIKKKLTPIIISASMILLLFTGCGGSESTVANSKEAEKSETVVENAGSEVTELVEAEKPVMKAQEGSTAAETNASDASEKRYLVKSEIIYIPLDDERKSFFDGREYDYDEFGHIIHMHFYNYEGHKGDKYYEYELDDEGRILKQQIFDGDKEKNGHLVYSYSGNHYKALYYGQSGWLLEAHEGFVKDGVYYRTERIFYDNEKHKTEADEEYDDKLKIQYDGTMEVKSEEFNKNGEKTNEYHYDYEMDENNNPIVRKTTYIDEKTGEEKPSTVIEYTYIEF